MGAGINPPQPQSSGKNAVTTPTTSAQPSFGQPNQYANTVGQGGWDNASIAPQGKGGGKGQSWQPFQPTWNPQNVGYSAPQQQAVDPQQIAQSIQRSKVWGEDGS